MANAKYVASWLSSNTVGSRTPVAVGIHKEHGVVAYPEAPTSLPEDKPPTWRSSITIHSLYDNQKYSLTLHSMPVQNLAFSSHAECIFLCSASEDCTLLWDVESIFQDLPSNFMKETNINDVEPTTHIKFSSDALYLAVSRGNTTYVYNTSTCKLHTSLVGHTSPISFADFYSLDPLTVITLSEDRTFKLWNLATSSLSHQSHIISSSPFLSGAINVKTHQLATGTADGMLRIFDLRPKRRNQFKCLLQCDMKKELEKRRASTISKSDSGGKFLAAPAISSSSSSDEATSASMEVGCAIIGLHYMSKGKRRVPSSSQHSSVVMELPPILLAVMHLALIVFNGNTLELLNYIDLLGPIVSLTHPDKRYQVKPVGTCDLALRKDQDEAFFVTGAMFSSIMTLLLLHEENMTSTLSPLKMESETLSVLSSQPLVSSSPLWTEFNLRSRSTGILTISSRMHVAGHSSAKSSQPGPPSVVLDKPVTFKSRVKSSGYTATPRGRMFIPKPSGSKKKTSVAKKGSKIESYPVEHSPTTHLQHSIMKLTERSSPIHTAVFNSRGDRLVCGSTDRIAYTIKMPPSGTSRTRALAGHDGAITSTCWSNDDKWLLTSSADKTARVWDSASKETVMILNKVVHNFRPSVDMQFKQPNNIFKREVNSAQFYYLDKFIVLTSESSFYLYKYYIDTQQPRDDIKTYLSNSHYKLVTTIEITSCQSITALSCINDFHSYIVLVGGSNKSLQVYDMNEAKCIRTMTDVHPRAIHCICQNKGSKYMSHLPESYNLFATSAITDGIKLWDLRTNRCVYRYTSHVNQSQAQVTAAFSPCGRYIATGSEDRTAYIYDLRQASPLHMLSGHSDTVTAIAYHPLTPMLVTTTQDGQVKFFTENAKN